MTWTSNLVAHGPKPTASKREEGKPWKKISGVAEREVDPEME